MSATRSLRSVAVASVASLALLGLLPAGAAQAGDAHAGRVRAMRAHGIAAVVRRHRHRPNYAWQLFRATNDSRRHHGLRPITRNHTASRAAERHSLRMARANRLFHSTAMGPYLNGVGRWSTWGENIGWTTGNVANLEQAFMASSVHRSHILSHAFRHVAVGAAMRGHKLWVTLVFYG